MRALALLLTITAWAADPTAAIRSELIDQAWAEFYAPTGIAAPIVDRAAMIRYGISNTPTFVTVDWRGKVRLYQPTRFTDAELEAAVARLKH